MSYSIHAVDPSGSFGRPLNPDWSLNGELPLAAGARRVTRELTNAGIAVQAGLSVRTVTWSAMAAGSAALSLVWMARWAEAASAPYASSNLGIAALNVAGTFACMGVLTKSDERASRGVCLGGAAIALLVAAATIAF